MAASALPQPGEQRPGALTYGVALVLGGSDKDSGAEQAGSNIPVYVRTADGTVWKGRAALDGAKRVRILFDQALVDGRVQAIQADAYGIDGYPGVPAQVSTQAPTLAADILNGFSKGALAFGQAYLTRSQQTVNSNGSVTTTQQTQPNFWVATGSSILNEAVKFPNSQGGLVAVAQVKPGTPIQVVVRGTQ